MYLQNVNYIFSPCKYAKNLLRICKQILTKSLSSPYQDVFALLVPSCCDKPGTSCNKFVVNKVVRDHLVTRLMTVTHL